MRGSKRQRGDAWELRVYVGVDPVNGRRRYATRTVRGSERHAETQLALFVAEVASGGEATSATVGQLLDRWWALSSADWSARTRVQTESAIRVHLRPDLGHVQLAKLTPVDVDLWFQAMRKKPGRGSKPLAPATVVRVGGILRSALTQAYKWGWISSNPAAAASPPKLRRPKVRPPSIEQVREVLRVIAEDDPDFHCYTLLAVTTGGRRSQLIGLHWSAVDLQDGRVVMETSVVDGDDGIVEQGTKNDDDWGLSLDTATLDALRSLRRRAEHRASAVGVALEDEAYVFTLTPDGSTPWRPDLVSHRWVRYRRRAGLGDSFRLHDLRHFMATSMLKSGVPVSVVAARLGHRRPSTTLNIYSHVIDGDDRGPAERLGEMLADDEGEEGP
ncbi:MAG: site-specific integrase [Actinomycetota bacterium]